MTGFAAVQRDIGAAIIHLEIKSVNSRYLDINFRLSEELRTFEMPLRELISARIARGKFECRGGLLPIANGAQDVTPNPALLKRLAELQTTVHSTLPQATPLSVAEVLRWPGMLGEQTIDTDTLQRECLALARTALDDFVASRAREGEKLAAMILDRVTRMRDLVQQTEPLLPLALTDYQERLTTKLREAVANLDEERIRQEIGIYATRIDVAEELSRLSTHLDELERVLQKGGQVGKRLDFLMQELNREANTLASKSVSKDITAIALEMKLLIEQIREQVQNLE